MIELNLLPKAQERSKQEQIWTRRVVLVGGLFLAILILDVVVFWAISFVLGGRVTSLNTTKTSLLAQADSLTDTAQGLRLMEEKLAGVDSIFTSRSDMGVYVTAVQGLLLTGVSMGKLTVDASGVFNFSARVVDEKSLAAFINLFSPESHFSQVTMKDLRQGEGANFSFQIDAMYRK